MGWCFSYDNTKKQEVERLLRLHDNLLDHSLVGNDLWVLAKWNEGQHISLYMIGYCHETRGYGYKGIDVTSGPYRYTCPKRLVDKMSELTDANDPCGYGREWLKKWHERRTAPKIPKWKVGDKVQWWDGSTFTLDRKYRNTWYTTNYYKVTTRSLNRSGKLL
jgi:hypothetical protein